MALLFGTTGDLVDLPPVILLPEASTTLMWFYPTTLTDLRRLWGQDGSGYAHSGYLIGGTELELEIARVTTSALATSSDAALSTGKWWCAAFTEDTTDGPRIFIGDLATRLREVAYSARTTGVGAGFSTADNGLTIGNVQGGTVPFQGRIAFVGRWRRRMTLKELWQQQWAPHPDADCEIFMWPGLFMSTVPAFGFDASAESHAGTTGSASEASFDFTIPLAANCRGVLVYTFVNANADNATSVKINPAGENIDVPAVSGGRAVDTAGEPGDCKAWFVGSGLAAVAGTTVTIRVNRTNNANVMYAVAASVVGAHDTEVVGTPTLQQTDGTLAEVSYNSGRRTAMRFAGINSGLAAIVDNPTTPGANNLSRGANSTALRDIDFGARVIQVVRETTAGNGSRSVGFSASTSDDRAAVYLSIAEMIRDPNLAPLALGSHGKIIGPTVCPNVPLALPFGVEAGVSGT